MKLIYVWDAICGWCYGFESVLTKFVRNHPELELKMVSGGSDYGGPHKAYKRV